MLSRHTVTSPVKGLGVLVFVPQNERGSVGGNWQLTRQLSRGSGQGEVRHGGGG